MEYTMKTTTSSSNLSYGIQSVRNLKANKRNYNEKTINEIQDYLTVNIDHVISRCISHMLCKQPENLLESMLKYFIDIRQNKHIESDVMIKSRPRPDQKLFLKTSLGPIISKLTNRLIFLRPSSPIDFIISELQLMIDSVSTNTDDQLDQNTNNNHETGELSNTVDTNTLAEKGVLRPKTAPLRRSEEKDPVSRPISALPLTSSQEKSSDSTPIHEKKTEKSLHVDVDPKAIQFAVLGMGSAGKTTIINSIKGDFKANVRQTLGFRPTSLSYDALTTVTLYDLGGSNKIKDIWPQYYHDVHGLIYVVDGTLSDNSQIEMFQRVIKSDMMSDKPILLLINKHDCDDCKSASVIVEEFLLKDVRNVSVHECCGKGVPEGDDVKCDPRIEEGLKWLIDTVIQEYSTLNERVLRDSAIKAQEEMRKHFLRERNVLKSKMAIAFYESIPSTNLPDGVEPSTVDVFSEEEGLQFLTSEIGEDLDEKGVITAALTGYHRVALQIVGGFKCPVSKKKVPMTWDEIIIILNEIRGELGLPCELTNIPQVTV